MGPTTAGFVAPGFQDLLRRARHSPSNPIGTPAFTDNPLHASMQLDRMEAIPSIFSQTWFKLDI
jgi:hypothetical protein